MNASKTNRERLPTRLFSLFKEAEQLRNGGAAVPRPRVLTHTVTFRCNARCVMCDSWRLPRQAELELDEIERIYGQIPHLDVLRLTGGEPFVRRDLVEIERLGIEHLAPRFVHVTTNAFLTDRVVNFVEKRDPQTPLHVLVSIDGVGDKHDEVRGVPESYARAVATLRRLVALRKSHNLRLAVNQTVLDREGARHYPMLRDEMAKLGVNVHLVVAYRESATYALERELERPVDGSDAYETHGEFHLSEIRALLDQAAEDLRLLDRGERLAKSYYLAGLRRRILAEAGPGAPDCVALKAHMRIFPNGDVPTCQQNSKVVGNLRHSPFAEVWASQRATEQRAWVSNCSGCWAECEVLPSAVYTGELAKHAVANAKRHLLGAKRRGRSAEGHPPGERPLRNDSKTNHPPPQHRQVAE